MNKPFSIIIKEKLKNNEIVLCPKCKLGHIEAKGKLETSKFFYCNNPDCSGKLILN